MDFNVEYQASVFLPDSLMCKRVALLNILVCLQRVQTPRHKMVATVLHG